jgi:hypothetical protein
MNKPNQVERGGEVHADTPDKWSDDDQARQEQGLPKTPATRNSPDPAERKPARAEKDTRI